jgi:ribonucleoside-diphosphate reductase alpha chain
MFGDKQYGSPVKARHLFTLICSSAWQTGDPGILFKDRINRDNKLYPEIVINTTNPCSEVALPHYGACCLGSINIAKFVKKGKFDFKAFQKYVEMSTRALINMNVISYYPLPRITKVMKELNPIGVGIMGFADALIKLGIYYDSEECLEFIRELGEYYKAGTETKITQGCFYKRIIAPTGSLSLLADCSSGVEPVFERHFQRHLTVGVMEEVRQIYQSKYCRTAMEISPEWHLKVQTTWQEQLDGGLSKTINLPASANIQDIWDIYYQAWELGAKGVTVFREGCKEGVLRKVSKCSDGECHL